MKEIVRVVMENGVVKASRYSGGVPLISPKKDLRILSELRSASHMYGVLHVVDCLQYCLNQWFSHFHVVNTEYDE